MIVLEDAFGGLFEKSPPPPKTFRKGRGNDTAAPKAFLIYAIYAFFNERRKPFNYFPTGHCVPFN